MAGSDGATITGVTGGSHGLEATYERVRELAVSYDHAGDRMRGWAGRGGATVANGDLLESAVLSPLSFAEAEVAVLEATTGPDGVLVESVGWETDAVLLRTTIGALETTDELVRASFEALDHLAGQAVGQVLGSAAPLIVAGVLAGALVHSQLPPHVQDQLGDRLDEEGLATLEELLTEHPELVQHLVNGGGGLLEGLWDGLTPTAPGGPLGLPVLAPDTGSAAGLLAALYGDDGTGVARPLDVQVPGSDTVPGSVAELVEQLGAVAALSQGADAPLNGTVQVQSTTGPDGEVRHVVQLPGTDDLTTLPWTQDGDVRDMATNFLLVGGAENAYQQGILDAMHQAGIGPGEPVLLVGHSMGGMEAAAILAQGSDFDVTHVVTAGSPTAQVDGFPPGSQVLSLEQHGDVVPLLDGEDNPGSTEQVTVQFDARPDGGIVDHHDYGTYVQGAAAVDASDDPSVQAAVASLHGAGFLGGAGTTTSQVFQIVRTP